MFRPLAPDLAVSVVHYRTPDALAACLVAIEAERSGLALTVTVTDNASGDDQAASVVRQFPWMTFIQNARNVGYGRAHNGALRGAQARHLLVLNADAGPRPGALRRLVDELDRQPDVAIVGPRLRYPDGALQSSRRRFPTRLTFFFESTQVQRVSEDNRVLRSFFVQDQPEDQVQDVDWLVGACLAVRGQAAAEIGLFDERFFLYSEDIDWCRRCRAAGWRVVYVPDAEVVHVEGASTHQEPAARTGYFFDGRLRYIRLWHGVRLAAIWRAYVLAESLARGTEEVIQLARRSRVDDRRAHLGEIKSALRCAVRG
jgi:N-acetylglucosaminyl-diphospho-decaprenol L-rhamnosyltransferase